MSALGDVLRDVLAQLARAGVRPALVGGLAVGARGHPRFTRDVDLAIAVAADGEAERLVHALRLAGYEPGAVLDHEVTGRLSTVRLQPQGRRGTVVDLLFASSGIEDEIVAAATHETVLGSQVPLATRGHLIATKVLSRDDRRRPQDAVDLRALLRSAVAEDIELARAALTTIAARGYARGKDLQAELDRAIADASLDDPGSLD